MIYHGKLTPFALLIAAIIGMQSMLPGQTTRGLSKPERGSVVPFVGCKSDGQVGSLEAPKGKSKVLSIGKEKARRLAYYKAKE
jgi:hypothetical protein